jgi:hypothetical protein
MSKKKTNIAFLLMTSVDFDVMPYYSFGVMPLENV